MYDARGKIVESKASARDTVLTVDMPDTLDEGTRYVVSWRRIRGRTPDRRGPDLLGRTSQQCRTTSTEARRVVPASGVRDALSVVQVTQLPGTVRGGRARRVHRVAAPAIATAGRAAPPAATHRACLGRDRGPGRCHLPPLQRRLHSRDWVSPTCWVGRCGPSRVGAQLSSLGMLTAGLAASRRIAWHHTVARSRARARHRVGGDGHRVPCRGRPLEAYPPQLLVVATDALHVAAGAVWLVGSSVSR